MLSPEGDPLGRVPPQPLRARRASLIPKAQPTWPNPLPPPGAPSWGVQTHGHCQGSPQPSWLCAHWPRQGRGWRALVLPGLSTPPSGWGSLINGLHFPRGGGVGVRASWQAVVLLVAVSVLLLRPRRAVAVGVPGWGAGGQWPCRPRGGRPAPLPVQQVPGGLARERERSPDQD